MYIHHEGHEDNEVKNLHALHELHGKKNRFRAENLATPQNPILR